MGIGGETGYLISTPAAPSDGAAGDCGTTALEISKRAVDFGGEEIEVSAAFVGGVEGVEAETFPPATGIGVQRTHDHRATGGLGIELSSGGQHVRDQCGAHALPVVATIDSQATKQQGGNGIWSVPGDARRRR